MPRNSLKSLLDMFPYFFNKSSTSNFYKSQVVTNNRFKEIYNDLFRVYESFHLKKRLLVWKEQSVPYIYDMHFAANYPNLKTVNIYKDNNLVYSQSFDEGESSSFSHVYSYDSRNEFSFVSPQFDDGHITVNGNDAEQLLLDSCLFWRIHVDDLQYDVKFHVDLPYLKSVKLYKNDTVIYSESYESSEYNTDVEYSYRNIITNEIIDEETGDTCIVDDIFYIEVETYTHENTLTKYLPRVEAPYIPQVQFLIEVETYDEYHLFKGWPENDTIQEDHYDHDESLDSFGAQNRIPRKKYIPIDTLSEFYKSEPPFNDRLTEDDYHYMQRIIEYNLRLHTTPAPVLEIWKLYGVEATMLNRERLLLKMFDIYRHPHHTEKRIDEYGREYEAVLVDEWTPERWEHKDKFFDDKNRLGAYFFVDVDNVRPIVKQPVKFSFKFLNSLVEDISSSHVVDIYLNDEPIVEDYTGNEWKCDSSFLDDSEPNTFMFIGKDEFTKTVGTVEIIVNVRGCDDADFYVCSDGDDTNDGTSTHPFRTLTKALNSVSGVYNLIAVIGELEINSALPVPENCTIIGCTNNNNAPKITNTNGNRIFHVAQGKTLTIGDITLETDQEISCEIDTAIYGNENIVNEVETTILPSSDYGFTIDDLDATVFIKNLTLNQSTGVLSWTEYDKSDFTKLSDFTGVVTNLELDEDLTFIPFTPSVDDPALLDAPYVFLEDRRNLKSAVKDITLSDPYLEVSEYDDDIIDNIMNEHSLDEYEYQHISVEQSGDVSDLGNNNYRISFQIKFTHPVSGQKIKFSSNNGLTQEVTCDGNTTGVYSFEGALQGTSTVNISLERYVDDGIVYIGSNTSVNINW